MKTEDAFRIMAALETTKVYDQSNTLWQLERLLRNRSHWSSRALTSIGLAEVGKLSADAAMDDVKRVANINSEIIKLLSL